MATLCLRTLVALCFAVPTMEPFAIEVVDATTGRGVPLIELETVNNQRFVTDSHGLVAITAPDLLGKEIYFHVRGHGYEFPADGFGFRGRKLELTPGGDARLEIDRRNIAERLYRVTGGGIYRDTVLLGRAAPIEQPLLNAQVFGSDSVVCDVYRGKIHWFWGDTNRPSYPLGNFHVPGATSVLPANGGLRPAVGIDLQYFVGEDGFARPTAQLPGEGPTWIGSLTVLKSEDGSEQMFAHYVKVRKFLEVYEWGLVRFNDETNTFDKVVAFALDGPVQPIGAHTFQHVDDSGVNHVYFAHPYAFQRVKADAASLADLAQYEAFTCLLPGSTLKEPRLDRAADGTLNYQWRHDAPALDRATEQRLIRQQQIKQDEARFVFRDVESGRDVVAHRGSTYWNEHRRRWVMIFGELGGTTSNLGEIWYAEADAPTGPWTEARQIVTHDKYSFYNPKHHPFFDEEGGRVIYFEGTYTQSFGAAPVQTPLYDYNQIMYRLDLANPRLKLPPR
ncbi:MAG: hypothetical protein KF708_24805 [Pirellulales bacterium]|nr:hypothetical protein [Pirellulales bacterium]